MVKEWVPRKFGMALKLFGADDTILPDLTIEVETALFFDILQNGALECGSSGVLEGMKPLLETRKRPAFARKRRRGGQGVCNGMTNDN